MIRLENHLGLIEVSQEYFSEIIGNAVSSCYGVAGMANSNARQGLRALLRRRRVFEDQGVAVHKDGSALVVDLHIIVTYGLNISVIVRSIVNKVRYTVEEATGLEVSKVNVFVDGMLSQDEG
jgi:uncharacterized alkaline shock family protein YloU